MSGILRVAAMNLLHLASVASLASCGSEFHKLATCPMKKCFLLLVLSIFAN